MFRMFRSMTIAAMMLLATVPAMASAGEETAPTTSFNRPVTLAPVASTIIQDSVTRPRTLPALYVSFAGLQILDARTTAGAIGRRAHESNPVLGHGNQATVWAVKAATAASTIYFAERLWKQNRIAAVAVMVGVNSGYAAIAAHNARLAR